ncbi:hypothetical protein C2E21_1509 [Chlorella sorokiniana]|uniref:Uncharacterized protein n=1 Tax=Chlorella sorokiniana TaxID=3076 RepID=A0A2P6U0J0_CHLSO|nr:hypothetical protein C2E21_1509 [Chlorella sorokiniana]|eukprot:PRW59841.1 hypothetical protein C2E21_1509 [Chlorella sorokiniana]
MAASSVLRATALVAAAMLLVAVVPRPAAALTASELALYKQLASGLATLSDVVVKNKPPPATLTSNTTGSPTVAAAAAKSTAVAAASTAASGAAVAKALGTVMAAAALDAAAAGTLGSPSTFRYLDGSKRTALFRLPNGNRPIKGTCIFVHGCKHDPESWFYKSAKCPKCTGLPEEVAHTKQCLARGYAVLALRSLDREYRSRCFSSSGTKLNDHPSSKQVVQAFTAKYGLANTPKYMFGISSGASFAVKFPGTMWVDGVISEVNMPWAKAWGAVDSKGRLKYRFPPTVFYEMANDVETSKQIAAALNIFRNNNVKADVVKVPMRPVTPDFLHQRSIYLSKQQSRQIQAVLRKIGLLDANGWIKYDPRPNTEWTKKLANALKWLRRDSPYYNLISDESQVWQELNLAYSQHEIVSDYVRPTLMWLEQRGNANLNALVQQYSLNGTLRCLNESVEGCGLRRARALLR